MKLTKLGKHEAYLRLYGILTTLDIAKDSSDKDKYLKLERNLSANLIKQWRKEYEKALKEIFKGIPSFELITSTLKKHLGKDFGKSKTLRELFYKNIREVYESSQKEILTDSHFKLTDLRAVDILTKHNCFWVGEHYEKHIGEKISEITRQALKDGLGRKELAFELRQALGGQVGDYKYWDVVSSSALVRSRSFGAISGMTEAGIKEYEVLAMGDERMCPICGSLNGQKFRVADAQEKINTALKIEDSERFKEEFGWGRDDMSLPPFHGRCRCVLVMSESTAPVEVSLEDRLKRLQAEDSEYQRKYDDLERQISEAVSNRDSRRYDELSKQQVEMLPQWQKLAEELKNAKIEAAEQGIIFASGLSKVLEESDVKAIIEAVKNAPEDVRKVWNIFEGSMKIADTSSKNSYYSMREGSIHIDITKDRYSTSRPAYSVILHELGHLIDNKSFTGGYFSQSYQYDLFTTLKSEVDEYINARLKKLKAEKPSEGIKKSDAYASVERELRKLPISSSMSVSDLFSGATLNKCKDNWSHTTSYWRNGHEVICTEFFAQVYSDSIVNPKGIETIKRYAPKSYAIFEKMLKDMAK